MATTRSVSYVKAHFAEVIQAVNESRDHLVVTQNGASAVVIQDHETFKRHRDAMLMLKLVAMGEADIAKGRITPQAEVFSSLKKRLKARSSAKKSGKPR